MLSVHIPSTLDMAIYKMCKGVMPNTENKWWKWVLQARFKTRFGCGYI